MRTRLNKEKSDDLAYLLAIADVLVDESYQVKMKTKQNTVMVQLAPVLCEQVSLRIREIVSRIQDDD